MDPPPLRASYMLSPSFSASRDRVKGRYWLVEATLAEPRSKSQGSRARTRIPGPICRRSGYSGPRVWRLSSLLVCDPTQRLRFRRGQSGRPSRVDVGDGGLRLATRTAPSAVLRPIRPDARASPTAPESTVCWRRRGFWPAPQGSRESNGPRSWCCSVSAIGQSCNASVGVRAIKSVDLRGRGENAFSCPLHRRRRGRVPERSSGGRGRPGSPSRHDEARRRVSSLVAQIW